MTLEIVQGVASGRGAGSGRMVRAIEAYLGPCEVAEALDHIFGAMQDIAM